MTEKRKQRLGYRVQKGTMIVQVKARTQVLKSESKRENTGYKSAEASGVLKTSPRHVHPLL